MRVCRPWVDVKSSYEIQIKQEEKEIKKTPIKMRNWKIESTTQNSGENDEET